MFPVQRIRPSTPLAPFILAYEERCARILGDHVVRPLPARTDQFIEFYLGDRYRLRAQDGGESLAPRTVAVGLQTRRGMDLLLVGDLRMFTVKFTPTGFQALFGTPQHILTDCAAPAGDVSTPDIEPLADPLACAASVEARVAIIEAWLLRRSARVNPDSDPVAWASRLMMRRSGQVRIDELVAHSGLCARQFERRFQLQVGTGPKRYARLLRFGRALDIRSQQPALSWAAIAQEAGFADQAHMIDEFKHLCGEEPRRWMTTSGPARETLIGDDVVNLQFRPSELH